MIDHDPYEVRLHGRGGQGTVTLAAVLVDAAVRAGLFALGFPSFGTERTGAPVTAFVRLSSTPVLDRGQIRSPRAVVVLDPTLLTAAEVLEGLSPDGLVVANTTATASLPDGLRVVRLPASEIAVRHLGAPITSGVMAGAFAAASGSIDIDDVCAAIAARLPARVVEANVAAAREAFDAVGSRSAA